jgi:hypothetical protein
MTYSMPILKRKKNLTKQWHPCMTLEPIRKSHNSTKQKQGAWIFLMMYIKDFCTLMESQIEALKSFQNSIQQLKTPRICLSNVSLELRFSRTVLSLRKLTYSKKPLIKIKRTCRNMEKLGKKPIIKK